jgi:GTP-binding protein
MPGIIKGAHEGKGLGLWFLRHIERTRMLVFVIDSAAGRAKADYRELVAEIRSHDPATLDRPRVIALNKQDLVTRPSRARFDVPVVPVSGLTGAGVAELHTMIVRLFPRA